MNSMQPSTNVSKNPGDLALLMTKSYTARWALILWFLCRCPEFAKWRSTAAVNRDASVNTSSWEHARAYCKPWHLGVILRCRVIRRLVNWILGEVGPFSAKERLMRCLLLVFNPVETHVRISNKLSEGQPIALEVFRLAWWLVDSNSRVLVVAN